MLIAKSCDACLLIMPYSIIARERGHEKFPREKKFTVAGAFVGAMHKIKVKVVALTTRL
jgi:hypothetical protein